METTDKSKTSTFTEPDEAKDLSLFSNGEGERLAALLQSQVNRLKRELVTTIEMMQITLAFLAKDLGARHESQIQDSKGDSQSGAGGGVAK